MMNANASSYYGSVDRNKDPIWGTPVTGTGKSFDAFIFEFKGNVPHCGGWYSIYGRSPSEMENLSNREKARLTSWLIEQRRSGTECPVITQEVIELVKQRNNMFVPDRADAILKYIESKTSKLGQDVIYASRDPIQEIEKPENLSDEQILSFLISNNSRRENYYNLIAYSESIDYDELSYLLQYLKRHNWIEIKHVNSEDYPGDRYHSSSPDDLEVHSMLGHNIPGQPNTHTESCKLTVEGYARLADIQVRPDSFRGFMAMWFDNSINNAWEQGFKPGIKNAGYEPMRIDQKQHVNKIDDEIIAEIRRSRFMVADFTQGETGARGGVYYEAGFAHGLDIPVIFTCREDCLENIHFDVRQYNCIIWKDEDLEKLQKDLTNRITAILGDGPGRTAN